MHSDDEVPVKNKIKLWILLMLKLHSLVYKNKWKKGYAGGRGNIMEETIKLRLNIGMYLAMTKLTVLMRVKMDRGILSNNKGGGG